MRQMEKTISIPVVILTLGFFSFFSFAQENSFSSDEAGLDTDLDFDGSDFGKRDYGYMPEYKRLPVYDFGLGKRGRHLYNFGLGKRSEWDADGADDSSSFRQDYYNDDDLDKRQSLYSFGLGKRDAFHRYDFGLGKRDSFQRYDFGLGRRSMDKSNNNRLYNFGLGKRNKKKKPADRHSYLAAYGLGKRSVDAQLSTIAKREVEHEQPPADPSATKQDNFNATAELESHEIMGHSDKSQVTKRSPYRYTFQSGKSQGSRVNGAFSRQFRKPLYNFGLGKRTSTSDDLTLENYKSLTN